ncbi:MAG: hypothetical protein J6K48_15325 [Lachnospiraceae bacterium]|nr:hypothetical protein [Lachnospiraceae bacterium]
MKKRVFIAFTAIMGLFLTMPFGSTSIVHAEEVTRTGLEVEFVDSLDEIMQDSSEVSVEELSHTGGMEQEDFLKIDILEGNSLGEFRTNGISAYSSNANSVTQEFTGVIEQEGGMSYLLITLAPGEILQATLAGPNSANINYDLVLYTYADGNLQTYVTESSLTTYINSATNKSVEDAISYINTGSASQDYVLIVYATQGCSSTNVFNLTVSLDSYENFDAGEPNDNPFTAVEVSAGVTISNCNLNVSNDQDWYVCQIPSSVSKVGLTLSNSNYTAEVYHASGKSMIYDAADSNGIYNLNPGYYYFRVYSKNENFVSSAYSLEIKIYGTTPAKMTVVFDGDMGTTIANYPEGAYHRFQSEMKPTVLVTDAAGYPVAYEDVKLTWYSEAWKDTPEFAEMSVTESTDADGIASFYMLPPQAKGFNSCVVAGTVRHYYDIDGISFLCGSVYMKQIIYHFSHSILL